MLISAYDKTDRLREMRTRGREGVKNPENFAYVLNGSPLAVNGPFLVCNITLVTYVMVRNLHPKRPIMAMLI